MDNEPHLLIQLTGIGFGKAASVATIVSDTDDSIAYAHVTSDAPILPFLDWAIGALQIMRNEIAEANAIVDSEIMN